jgi:hypothetical protein
MINPASPDSFGNVRLTRYRIIKKVNELFLLVEAFFRCGSKAVIDAEVRTTTDKQVEGFLSAPIPDPTLTGRAGFALRRCPISRHSSGE